MSIFLDQWRSSKTGPLTMNGLSNDIGFRRFNESDPEVQKGLAAYGDPASGNQSPHFMHVPVNGFAFGTAPTNNSYFSFVATVVQTQSRGSVTLNSTNPLGAPVIDTALLTNPYDLFAMRQAFKAVFDLLATSPWVEYLVDSAPALGLQAVIDSNFSTTVIDDYITSSAGSGAHAVGTAAMSPVGATWGVVDPDLKVKGLTGLRIADASVLPYVTSNNVQFAVYIVGERASELIKAGI